MLFVGWIHPTKKFEWIVRGYLLAKANLTNGHKFVIVGGDKGPYAQMMRGLTEELQLSDDVIFTGYIPDEDLQYVYILADLLLFPTNQEAFGIAALESMACSTPVIASNKYALPKVTGDAAVLADPASEEEIADAVVRVLASKQIRQGMIEHGFERSKPFSWEGCARETLKVYEELDDAQ